MKRFYKILKRMMLVFLSLIILFAIATLIYMQQDKFGQLPEGERLAKIEKSPNYKNGKFYNKIEKPTITQGYSFTGEIWKAITKKYPRTEPIDTIPTIKTDLKNLPPDSNLVVWFGHSSFLLQIDGKRILADPVFSNSASPISGLVKAYKGTNIYTAEDMPEIDYLLISHDHYDHLDYKTIKALNPKVKKVICGLGVGAHFEKWGYATEKLLEKDWGDNVKVGRGFTIFTESTHHDCGRGFISSKALWLSFLIVTPTQKIYYSGDGGYDHRFKEINKKYGVIDWAIMECGQYNPAWEAVHNLPEQVVKATEDLQAKNLLPVHHSKFTLAKHPWDEPLIKMTEMAKSKPYRLATPMIGEVVYLKDNKQVFKQWWKGIK
ncbi:MBL fold metallo-hydrolase [Pedobacter nototheniae]|uniref:MBL fold metallo-hydrolase n=1 Tax=Pedobacter nototheniae TaxID=2488994 RepID=UPI00292FCAC4|nr:MBL fold metallo-hydrolase [Pedobacter nototheniae]